MCDKIFLENPAIKEKDLIKRLEKEFEVDKVIFIPGEPKDYLGHADGMLRFYDNNTVLLNDYSKEDKEFQLSVRMALHNAGLSYIEIPYNPYGNLKNDHAHGIYINYLQMSQAIVIPVFNMKEDDEVVKLFERLYPRQTIRTVESSEIASEGGLLNCITWNVLV